MTIDEFLTNPDFLGTLTDFAGGQHVFHAAFRRNDEVGHPVHRVLELGVCRPQPGGGFPLKMYGQSTKTLMALSAEYNVEEMVSLDIDECHVTTDFCFDFVAERFKAPALHAFEQIESLKYKPTEDFDFIFLDTNHDDNFAERVLGRESATGGAGHTYRELAHFSSFLSPFGRMFIHDTKNFYVPRAYGVNSEGAIQQFLDEHAGWIFREHSPNENGLGELVRQEAAEVLWS